MDRLAALRTSVVADRYRTTAIEPERLERILAAATDTPGFARQFPLRLLVIRDDLTKRALRGACETQRARWFHNVAEWLQKALVEAGEPRQLTVLSEAPCVVCVFGETEKPGWREAGWAASERLRVAARAEGLHAGIVHVDSLGFLNALLDVPATFTGVALLTLGEPESVRTPDPVHYDDLVIPYFPDAKRLASWNNPTKMHELARKQLPPPRPFLSHKELLLNVVRTACEIANSRSLDHVFSLATGQLRRLFRYDHASIGFLDPVDGKVRLRQSTKESGTPACRQEIPLTEDNVIGWVILNKSGILRNEIARDGMFTEQMSSESMQSDMIVPVVSENTVLGTINIGSTTANNFTQSDFDVLREFGKLIGGAVERLQASGRQRPIGVPAGVLSSGKFPAHLAVEVARCRDRGAACGLLIVSLDDPKGTDTRAPEVEDMLQASVARVIRECTREIDMLARVAGRDLAVILPDVEAAGLPLIAERIRAAVQARVHTGGDAAATPVRITVSIGASVVGGASAESAGLFEQAAAALRRAQGQGRNRFCVYDPEQDATQASGAGPTSSTGA
jgi:diguanylate cyclase (GGDEF)-like protein